DAVAVQDHHAAAAAAARKVLAAGQIREPVPVEISRPDILENVEAAEADGRRGAGLRAQLRSKPSHYRRRAQRQNEITTAQPFHNFRISEGIERSWGLRLIFYADVMPSFLTARSECRRGSRWSLRQACGC